MPVVTPEQGVFVVVVGAIIEHVRTGTILLLKRSPNVERDPGIWEDPAGRVQQHEEPETALSREIKEEAGLNIEIVKPLNIFHEYRRLAGAVDESIGIIYWCRATSQEVHLSQEHSEYKWILPEEGLELTKHVGVQADIKAYLREKQKTTIKD